MIFPFCSNKTLEELRASGPDDVKKKGKKVIVMKEYEMTIQDIAHENMKRKLIYTGTYRKAKEELVECIIAEICEFEERVIELKRSIAKKYANNDDTLALEELLSETTPVREILFFTDMLKRYLS